MYMEYKTLSDFRANTKQAFDNARKVGTVIIWRGQYKYLLVSEDRVKAARAVPERLTRQEYDEPRVVNEGWGA